MKSIAAVLVFLTLLLSPVLVLSQGKLPLLKGPCVLNTSI